MQDLIRYLYANLCRWYRSPSFRRPPKVFHYGDSRPGKTVYIIKRDDAHVGLFSYILTNIGHLAHAEKKGYLPVIDMQNFPNTYLPDDKLGIENSWEYYFEQPTDLSLKEAYTSDRVAFSPAYPFIYPSDASVFFHQKKLIQAKWRKYVKKYIKLKPHVVQHVDEVYNRLFKPGERVLGIKCRGTDYVAMKPEGHPVQPEISDVIAMAHKLIKEYDIDKIFIATEDESIENIFLEEFPGITIKSEQVRPQYDGIHWITELHAPRENDEYFSGLEYLTTILLLARCNCFISGRNSGAVGVYLFSDGFEYDYVWDLGTYACKNPVIV